MRSHAFGVRCEILEDGKGQILSATTEAWIFIFAQTCNVSGYEVVDDGSGCWAVVLAGAVIRREPKAAPLDGEDLEPEQDIAFRALCVWALARCLGVDVRELRPSRPLTFYASLGGGLPEVVQADSPHAMRVYAGGLAKRDGHRGPIHFELPPCTAACSGEHWLAEDLL